MNADDDDKNLDHQDFEKEEAHPKPDATSTDIKLDGDQLPPAGVFLSSVVLLVAITSAGGPDKDTDNKYWAYGISLSVIAMFFAFVLWGLAYKPGLMEGAPQIPHILSILLFAWNFIGACIMTFGDGPFIQTSNGYFAAWGMAIFAIMGLGLSSKAVKNAGSMMGHLSASLIVIIALASADEAFDYHEGESIFGIIMACLSASLVIYQVAMERARGEGLPPKVMFPLLALFAICWIVSASLLTFRGPFLVTGNGYFGAWGGAVTGVFAAVAAKQDAS